MKKICLVLPFPPPHYGPSVYSEYFLKAINKIEGLKVSILNSEINNNVSQIGNKPLRKLFKYMLIIIKLPFYTYRRHLITNLNIMPSGVLKSLLIILFSKPFVNSITLILHEGGLKDIYSKASNIYNYLIKLCVKNANLIIALDPIQKHEWKNIYEDSIIEILPAYREEPINSSEKNIITFFSNLIPEKGVFDTVEIWKKYNEKYSTDTILYIIGSSRDSNTDKVLQDEAKNIKNLELRINISRNDALTILSTSKIFIMPTTYFLEQQPAVMIEALSYGIPIISYNWRGIPFMVKNDINGYCVDIKDFNSFAKKINQILTDNKLHDNFSKKSKQLYYENHSQESFTKKFEHIIDMYLI